MRRIKSIDFKKKVPLNSNYLEKIKSTKEASSGKNVNAVVEILLNDGILTQKQIEHAHRVLSKLESPRPLTCLLKELKFFTDDQLKNALASNPIKMAIGDLLVELGHVKEKDLRVAQAIQENDKSKRNLEQILIDQHLIDEHVLMELLGLKLGLPYVEPEFGQIDPKLISKAPIKWFIKHRLVPLKNENHKVRIAFVDPQDEQSLNAAKQVFGNGILPALTSLSALNNVLQWAERINTGEKVSTSKEGVAVKFVNKIILAAIDREASDIHIEPLKDRLRIRFRQDGVLMPFEELSKDVTPALTNRIK
ncbi:MAG: ATPase, T2SS/T4P/T4SS family, partial [Desulfobacterales bacterium]